MYAVVAKRTPDGGFEFVPPVEIDVPEETQGTSVLDDFARWAAARYRKEMEGKEEAHDVKR